MSSLSPHVCCSPGKLVIAGGLTRAGVPAPGGGAAPGAPIIIRHQVATPPDRATPIPRVAALVRTNEILDGAHGVLVHVLYELGQDGVLLRALLEARQVLEQWDALVDIPGPGPSSVLLVLFVLVPEPLILRLRDKVSVGVRMSPGGPLEMTSRRHLMMSCRRPLVADLAQSGGVGRPAPCAQGAHTGSDVGPLRGGRGRGRLRPPHIATPGVTRHPDALLQTLENNMEPQEDDLG